MTAADGSDRPDPDADLHRRAKELFLAALERPAAGREAWLAEACGGDAALRAEARSLLAHHEPGTLAVAPAPVAAPAAPPATLRLRKRVDVPAGLRRRRRLSVALALGAVLLLAAAVAVHRSTGQALRGLVERQLAALVDSCAQALRTWLAGELHLAVEFAAAPRVRALAAELVDAARGADPEAGLAAAQAQRSELAALLEPLARRGSHRGFALVDAEGRLLAFSAPAQPAPGLRPGVALNAAGRAGLARAFRGESWVHLPWRAASFVDAWEEQDGDAVLGVVAPVPGADGRPLAALVFVLRADADFAELLGGRREATHGQAFAFDGAGRLLSRTRHAAVLADAGLLPAGPTADPDLHLPLRDPGADLAAGERPVGAPEDWPPTRLAAQAVQGRDGVDVEGYRDVAGARVVGAWRWLAEHDFGVAVEVDAELAYAPLAVPRRALLGLLVLAVAALAALARAELQVARLRREVAAEVRFGQYVLEAPIGQGGAGQVWRARHALLQRPTAVKLLRPDALAPGAAERLELEVRSTARLTHPNTIEVYDCGFTEEGQFFYAMELLDGLSLAELVRRHGRQPAPRVLHLLRQACASLAEAHAAGLVHRDVKPGNLMLCRLGGELDVVKVLDFGLVKDLAAPEGPAATMALGGTPLYMSPERLQPGAAVDARCDVWAVGATAFKLLTGRDLWSGSVADVFVQLMSDEPPHLAEHAPGPLPEGLAELVADCLQRDPARRPRDAGELLERLAALPAPPWRQADARAWWAAHGG